MWLSLSMIMLDRSCRCGSMPPTSIPYFSTSRKPGVVLRVPAMMPLYPCARAMSRNFFDLPPSGPGWQTHERRKKGGEEGRREQDALCRDAAAAREHVERDALAEEDVPRLSADGRDVLDGLERLAFFQVPFHPAHTIS